MKTVAIIPARMESKRFPGKPLALLAGKPIIQWTWERANQLNMPVYIASDSLQIREWAKSVGARFLRSPLYGIHNGTERCFHAGMELGLAADDFVLNIQGDQVEFSVAEITEFIFSLGIYAQNNPADCYTFWYDIDRERLANPNVVKVSINHRRNAQWFSRAPISTGAHLGIYGYFFRSLFSYSQQEPTMWEEKENLEQMRWLYYNWTIRLLHHKSMHCESINIPEDIPKVEAKWKKLKWI